MALISYGNSLANSRYDEGLLDYLLQNHQTFLVIEVKNEDLERGLVQLAVELITLDQWIDLEQPLLQSGISTGNIWQFGQFDRQSRAVTQDLDLYRVPADLDNLLRILIRSLES